MTLDEMERNLVKQGACTPAQASRLRHALIEVFPEAEVTGYEQRIEQMINHPRTGTSSPLLSSVRRRLS